MSETFKTHYVSLDMYKTSSDTFEVVEGDTANLIVITLSDRGNPVDLTGCKVLVVFVRGGVPAQQDTDGNGVTISGEHNNIINVDLYASSYANGNNTAEVQVWSGENYERLATSAWFNFKARRAKINDNTLLAVPTFPLLSGMLAKLLNIVRGVQAKWSTTDSTDPSYIQDKPVIGTDIQAPTNSLPVDYAPVGTDAAPIYRFGTGHIKMTLATILGYIRAQLDTYFAPLSHAARHAFGAADAITTDASPTDGSNNPLRSGGAFTALAGKSNLSSGIVAQAEARTKLIEKTASWTLSAADIECVLVCNSSSAITVTIPLDSAYNAPVGTCFSFIRWGTGTLTFVKDASANWIPLNSVTAVSVQGGAATLIKIAANVWWLSCN